MGQPGLPELLLVLFIIALIFVANKLPALGRGTVDASRASDKKPEA